MKRLVMMWGWMMVAAGGVVWVQVSGGRSEVMYQQRAARLWIRDLASGNYEVQSQAEQAVAALDADAVPDLIVSLNEHETCFDRLWQGFGQRLRVLPVAGPTDYGALRQQVARQLGQWGKSSEAAARALVEALGDEEKAVRTEAQHALHQLGPEAIASLVNGAQHGNPSVRSGAIEVLGEMNVGETKQDLADVVLKSCRDRDEQVRVAAIQVLGRKIFATNKRGEALQVGLRDPSWRVRVAAAEALSHVPEARDGALPHLEKALNDPVTAVRIAAARTHWILSGRTAEALPVLVATLADAEAGWKVPFILGEMGPRAAEAVPALIERLKQERVPRPLRSPPSAAMALGHIGSASVPPLVELLKDSQAPVRIGAALALGLVGPPAHDAAEALVRSLGDSDVEFRQAAALSLASIQPESERVVPALKEMARDDDVFLSSTAATILRRSHPETAAEMGIE